MYKLINYTIKCFKLYGTIAGTVDINSNAITESVKTVNINTRTSEYILTSGNKTIKLAQGSYRVTIQSGSSGGGGGGGRSGNGHTEDGEDGVKGGASSLSYTSASYKVDSPNNGAGGATGSFQGDGKDGGDAYLCLNGSTFVKTGNGGAGGTYGGSSTGGTGGDGGYCHKEFIISLSALETVNLTAGTSGNGGKGGDASVTGACGNDGFHFDCNSYSGSGGAGGTISDFNGKAGSGQYDADRFYAYATGGGGGSGPNGKIIIIPMN